MWKVNFKIYLLQISCFVNESLSMCFFLHFFCTSMFASLIDCLHMWYHCCCLLLNHVYHCYRLNQIEAIDLLKVGWLLCDYAVISTLQNVDYFVFQQTHWHFCILLLEQHWFGHQLLLIRFQNERDHHHYQYEFRLDHFYLSNKFRLYVQLVVFKHCNKPQLFIIQQFSNLYLVA